MAKKRNAQHSIIRPFRYSMRTKYEVGMTIALRQTLTQTALIAIYDGPYFYVYDYESGRVLDDGDAHKTFHELIEDDCGDAVTLFVGNFSGIHNRLSFEGAPEPNRIRLLKELLFRAFGYERLHADALRFMEPNPLICLGSYSLGDLRSIVEETSQGLPDDPFNS